MNKNWGFSSLMLGKHSMGRTGQKCFGLSGTSGLVARSSPLTVTTNGPPWWCETQRTGLVTFCIARRT